MAALNYKYFRFNGHHLEKLTTSYIDSICNSAIELLDPKNGGLAVETALLSCLETEI